MEYLVDGNGGYENVECLVDCNGGWKSVYQIVFLTPHNDIEKNKNKIKFNHGYVNG